MRARISPALPAATASGLMMEKVLSATTRSLHATLRTGSGAAGLLLAHDLGHRGPDVRRRLDHADAGVRHRLHLLRRRTLSPRDDGPGVAHPAAGGGRLPRDEAHHRLLDVGLHEGGRLLL